VKNEDILFELIKFDMEQIRIYREAILYISITCITGSFGVIAYAFKRDSGIASARRLWLIRIWKPATLGGAPERAFRSRGGAVGWQIRAFKQNQGAFRMSKSASTQ